SSRRRPAAPGAVRAPVWACTSRRNWRSCSAGGSLSRASTAWGAHLRWCLRKRDEVDMATILIVDDRSSNREYLTTLLSYVGHRLLEATSAAEALAHVRAERPDLVIADIVMPEVDGFEFVRRLRADPSIAQTRVMFYTATYLEGEARSLAQSCGVSHFLVKPAEPQMIIDTVRDAIA